MATPLALVFRGLDPGLPVTIYRRDLPHWRQDGATYFVTFRLADSIPANILWQWREERKLWFEGHGLHEGLAPEDWQQRYRAISTAERRSFERTQARRLFEETDRGYGACRLADPVLAQGMASALRHFHGVRFGCGDFVVMPNHVHWIVQPFSGQALEGIVGSIKRHVATLARRGGAGSGGEERGTDSRATLEGGGGGRFWQAESYDHLIRDRVELARIRRYVADNPGKAGLRAEQCPQHRAAWLDEERG